VASSVNRFEPHTRGAEWLTTSPELLKFVTETAIPPETVGLPRFVCTTIDSTTAPHNDHEEEKHPTITQKS
jgi:hypothetical protein